MSDTTEIAILREQLRLQMQTDEYKNDLITTLQDLLASKEKLIGELRERISE